MRVKAFEFWMSSNRLNGLNDGLTHLNRIGLTLFLTEMPLAG